ncbi:MAG: beta-galactosidase [Actinoplanes sp.]
MIHFGGDYNPDQWPEQVWAEDLALMRQARVTLVTVGVFAWSRLQPAPDTFDFGWLDRVLDGLAASGIGVCLATPTASPPPWFTRFHPAEMPETASGVRLSHGSRDTYCVNAPTYRAASIRIAGVLSARYATHPALRMWHVHNEYGTTCYCDHCAAAFRTWLGDRYGDVAALNDAWSTDFWSQRYGDLAEVLPPRATQYLGNPAHLLDYRRFVSDAMLGHYRAQRAVLAGAPVTTNFVLGAWVPVDHARWAREVDVVAVDDYPTSISGHLAARAFTADLARGWAGGEPWLLMEHAPGAVGDQALPPGEATAAAETYLDRGAAGVMYFQWRAGRGGAEQWHPAMVPHEGPDTPVFAEMCAIGERLAGREPTVPVCDVALIYDEETRWAWESAHQPARLDYDATCRRWHAEQPGPIDVLPPGAGLDGYRLVLAPLLHLMAPGTHAALRDYVHRGGTLVLGYASGLVDENCRVTPGALDDLIGARIVRRGPLAGAVPLDDGGVGRVWFDELVPDGATVLVRAADGRPAVTSHRFGAGEVRYLATELSVRASVALRSPVPPEGF